MKRIIGLAGAVALLAMPAVAGINPCDPGLPQAWDSTLYGVTIGAAVAATDCTGTQPTRLSVVNSYSSAFCVECHGRNPSDKITTPSGVPGGTKGTHDMGSHYVIAAAGDTNSGGGYSGSFGDAARTGGEYEKTTLWAPIDATGAVQATKGLSKYGDPAAIDGVANIITSASTGSVVGDMVCESCHNILVNNGDQLLLDTYTNNDDDQICVNCHAAGDAEADGVDATYANFHANGNLKNFNDTLRKRHHVLSGDTLDFTAPGPYNPDDDIITQDSVMWAPSYSRELGTGKYDTWVISGTPIADDTVVGFRGLVNVSGVGTQATAAGADQATGTNLMCNSCHRPHNAVTNAGAHILRGYGNYTSTNLDGLARNSDMVSGKVFGEYAGLCRDCHAGY